jgi:hypothetical protein
MEQRMSKEIKAPVPAPKPWIRTSADIIEQAQSMMTSAEQH